MLRTEVKREGQQEIIGSFFTSKYLDDSVQLMVKTFKVRDVITKLYEKHDKVTTLEKAAFIKEEGDKMLSAITNLTFPSAMPINVFLNKISSVHGDVKDTKIIEDKLCKILQNHGDPRYYGIATRLALEGEGRLTLPQAADEIFKLETDKEESEMVRVAYSKAVVKPQTVFMADNFLYAKIKMLERELATSRRREAPRRTPFEASPSQVNQFTKNYQKAPQPEPSSHGPPAHTIIGSSGCNQETFIMKGETRSQCTVCCKTGHAGNKCFSGPWREDGSSKFQPSSTVANCAERKNAIGKGPLTKGPTASRDERQAAYYTNQPKGGFQHEDYLCMLTKAEELGYAKGQAAMVVVQGDETQNENIKKEEEGVDGSYFAGQYALHD